MTHDAHNRDNFYPHTEIEGGWPIDPERDARLRAACDVGDALGLDNPRAEARIAADLGGVDGMGGAFAGAVGAIKARQRYIPNACPKCGVAMEYEPAQINHVEGGYLPERLPATLYCDACDYVELVDKPSEEA